MGKVTLARIKGIQVLLFMAVILMLFFGGCGTEASDDGSLVRLEDMAASMSGGVDVNALGTEEWKGAETGNGSEERSESDGTVPVMEQNPNACDVIYQGTPFISSCRAIGGDSIFSTGYLGEFDGNQPADGDYFAGRIGIEENTIQEFALEFPEDMLVFRSCTDEQGRWHLFLSQKVDNILTYERSEIWIINREGQLEGAVDVTECIKKGNTLPVGMTVDQQGNYYLLLSGGGNLLRVDGKDQTAEFFPFEDEYMDGLGVGRSGAVYGVFTQGGKSYLGIIDTESGSVEKCADFPENSVRPGFDALQPGASTELLLANRGEGVWSYDGTALELAVPLKDITANGQDISAMGFLWDGRVCVMSYENEQYVFHYVPAE